MKSNVYFVLAKYYIPRMFYVDYYNDDTIKECAEFLSEYSPDSLERIQMLIEDFFSEGVENRSINTDN